MKYVKNGQEVTRAEWLEGAPGFTPGHPPAAMTDAVFLENTANGRQFQDQPKIGDLYKKAATAAGVSTVGKVYKASLAQFPMDPRAWVSGRADVQRICEENGWGCSGAVTVKRRQFDLAPVDLAESLVEDEAVRIAEARGALADEGLKEQIRAKRRPPRRRNCT